MAGSYPDVPSRRFGHDADGSIMAIRNLTIDSPWVEAGGTDHAEMNNEESAAALAQGSGGSGNAAHLLLMFPELRELDGYFMASANPHGALESSVDTTNGIDGTWVTQIADVAEQSLVWSGPYRDEISSLAASGIRAIRQEFNIAAGGQLRAMHVYGDITPGETPDRLLFIDEATGLEFTASHDFGDIPRGSSEDITWRIRNNSGSLTATTIQYTTEDLYLGSGSWYTHTLPGGSTYQSTRQVASLAPSTTTGLITTRRITPGTEDTGLHAGRVYLNVDTWS